MSLLQNEDFKTEAQITGAGGTASQLLNDTKIWVTGNSINKTLDDAIADGDIGGGGGTFVGCAYSTNAAQSFANNTETTVLFEDLIFDTDSGMNTGTGKYTIPSTGKYMITSMALFNTNTNWSVTEYVQNALYKNSAVLLARTYNNSWVTTASGMYAMASLCVYVGDFTVSDTVYCALTQTSGASNSLAADGSLNQITIQKVG